MGPWRISGHLIVARAVYAVKTPIISGTGHEVDTTIADYVADLRAPTPSAAAELAIPDVMTVIRQREHYRNTMERLMNSRVSLLRAKRLELSERLHRKGPENTLRLQQLRLAQLSDRLHDGMQLKEERTRQRAALLAERLHGLSPTAKLRRGFGYLEMDGEALDSAEKAEKGRRFTVTLHDGSFRAEVL